MRLNYLSFNFERDKTSNDNTRIFIDYCSWLGIMYWYYLRPVISDKMRLLEVIITETGKSREEKPVSKYNTEGEHVNLYIQYDPGNLTNKPFTVIQKTLLDIFHNRLMEYANENNLDENVFQGAYNNIIENNFIFEKNYMKPVSNNMYTAQVSFKFDFQNTGVFEKGLYVEMYKDSQMINKIKIIDSPLRAINERIRFMEWEDENNFTIECSEYGDYYWKINVNGTIELENVHKKRPDEIFNIGICYYRGEDIARDEKKGLMLIKKAAEMGSRPANRWITYPMYRNFEKVDWSIIQ